jgi:hypothetical protein
MDEDGLQQIQMGSISWFGELVQHVVDNAKKKFVTRLLTNLGNNLRWKNSRASTWSRNFH